MSAWGRCEYCSGRAEPKGQRCELCKARQVRKSAEHVADREGAALEKLPTMDDVAKSLMGVFRPPGGAWIPNPGEGGSTPSRFAKRRTQVFIDEAAIFDNPEFEKLCRLMRCWPRS